MNDQENMFRSVVTIIAIDGTVGTEELQFLHTVRKRLNITTDVVMSVLDDAKQGKRNVYIPENPEDTQMLCEFLVQAAYADGEISPQEQKVLTAFAKKIGMTSEEFERLMRTFGPKPPKTPSEPLTPEIPPSPRVAKSPAKPTRKPIIRSQKSKTCPKCGYQTTEADDPLFTRDECPACGIVISRYRRTDKDSDDASVSTQDALHSGWAEQTTRIALIVGLILSLLGGYDLYEYRRMHQWPETGGHVLRAETRITRTMGKKKSTHSTFIVKYEYTVNGQRYENNRVGGSFIRGIFASFSISRGQHRPVFYDPYNPQDSILLKGSTVENTILLVLGMALLGYGVLRLF